MRNRLDLLPSISVSSSFGTATNRHHHHDENHEHAGQGPNLEGLEAPCRVAREGDMEQNPGQTVCRHPTASQNGEEFLALLPVEDVPKKEEEHQAPANSSNQQISVHGNLP